MRPLGLGIVGGGPDSMIGATHRWAATLDNAFELVAGVFSRDEGRSRSFATGLGIAPDRIYRDYEEMAVREGARADRIDAVSILTRNDTHAPASIAFLERGMNVICEKPMALSAREAEQVRAAVGRTGCLFALTHNYAGYAVVREARQRIEAGELGPVRVVQVEHASGARSHLVEAEGDEKTAWRTDPSVGGPSAVLGDLGTHAHHLARYVTGLEVEAVSAETSILVPGRTSHDNAHVNLRLGGGARGTLWASYVAAGNAHGLRLRVYGERASIEWIHEDCDVLHLRPVDGPPIVLRRGDPWLGPAARRLSRTKVGQPEGFLEAFANLYGDVAEQIHARVQGREADLAATTVASARDGVIGMRFVEAAVASGANAGAWTPIALD